MGDSLILSRATFWSCIPTYFAGHSQLQPSVRPNTADKMTLSARLPRIVNSFQNLEFMNTDRSRRVGNDGLYCSELSLRYGRERTPQRCSVEKTDCVHQTLGVGSLHGQRGQRLCRHQWAGRRVLRRSQRKKGMGRSWTRSLGCTSGLQEIFFDYISCFNY